MQLSEQAIRQFIEQDIRPKVRVDGGDIVFEGLSGSEVTLVAHADCATCIVADNCLRGWIEQQLGARFGTPLRVRVVKRRPYFTK